MSFVEARYAKFLELKALHPIPSVEESLIDVEVLGETK